MAEKEEDDFTLGDEEEELTFGGESAESKAETGFGQESGAAGDAVEEEAAEASEAEEEAFEEPMVAAAPVKKKTIRRGKVPSNVYTVLTFVALVALTTAVVVMWMTNLDLTQGARPADTNPVLAPFQVVEKGKLR